MNAGPAHQPFEMAYGPFAHDEYTDGARFEEARRGARAMRQRAARNYDHPVLGGAFPFERQYGTLWFGMWK